MKKIVRIKNAKEMAAFAARYAGVLRGGDIIGLVGDLGAGKTTFMQGLAAAFGVRKPVRSPTFILMQVFKCSAAVCKKSGIAQICHIDAYRLKDENELFAIGFEDYADRRDTIILIEWADRLPSVQWLDHYQEIRFAYGEDGERVLTADKMPIRTD